MLSPDFGFAKGEISSRPAQLVVWLASQFGEFILVHTTSLLNLGSYASYR